MTNRCPARARFKMANQADASGVSYATDGGNVTGTSYHDSPDGERPDSPGPNKKRKVDPSCQSCYLKKIKCDRKRPICTSCIKRNLTVCEYIDRKEADRNDLPRPKKSSTYSVGQEPVLASTSDSSRSFYDTANGSSSARARLSGAPLLPEIPGSLHPAHMTGMSAESMDGFVDRIASLVAQKMQANGTGGNLCTSCNKANGGHHREGLSFGRGSHKVISSLLLASSDQDSPEREAWAWDALKSLPGDEAIEFAVKFFCVSVSVPSLACRRGALTMCLGLLSPERVRALHQLSQHAHLSEAGGRPIVAASQCTDIHLICSARQSKHP